MTGRGWAYVGAGLGGTVSVAANVAHSYVPPPGAPAGWAPQDGAIGGAVFWPVALFVAIEILARVTWPAGWRYALVRFAGLLPVAVVAAVVSYRHLSGLLHWYGEDALTVVIGPLAVDGLMVMATGALVATGGRTAASAGAGGVGCGGTSTVDVPVRVPTPAGTRTPDQGSVDVPDSPSDQGSVDGRGTRTGRTGTRRSRRTGTSTVDGSGTRTDVDLAAVLATVPREPDGTVPVRRAATALGCGTDRARRLLADAGLLRTPVPTPVNGDQVSDLLPAGGQ